MWLMFEGMLVRLFWDDPPGDPFPGLKKMVSLQHRKLIRRMDMQEKRCILAVHICLQHGTICSFHLTHAEGRKDVILPIYREWSKMPELIVYDFACGASEYVLNRFPKLFANTRFCHDKFHQMTHTRCGAALRLDRKGGRAYNYNSSIMEQKNAIFRGLDKTLSNAKLDYALFLIQAVVTGLNEIQACTGADTET
eukprot:m.286499 g.286499  ORF g.286499 m.286499 type:complete len:195 (-) comp17778_c0_seq33:48-632(-)